MGLLEEVGPLSARFSHFFDIVPLSAYSLRTRTPIFFLRQL